MNESDPRSTREHIERIVERHQRLTDVLEDAFAQLLVSLGRADPTPEEIIEWWHWAKTLPITGASTRSARAMGHSPIRLSMWERYGCPDSRSGRAGTFPIDMQLTIADGVPCVYLLLVDAEVVYVGMSMKVRARLKSHWKDKRKSNLSSWQAIVCESAEEALALEGDLIYQHQPRYNIADRLRRRTTGTGS